MPEKTDKTEKMNKSLDRVVKEQTLKWLKLNQPFTYGHRLAIYGEDKYKCPSKDSFKHGVNVGLDYYNRRGVRTEMGKFYALVVGAHAVLDYVVKYDRLRLKEDEE